MPTAWSKQRGVELRIGDVLKGASVSAELLDAGGEPAGVAAADVEVNDVVHDSRRCETGALFACVPGERTDGHDHATSAVAAGAVAVLVERPLVLGSDADGVVQVLVSDVRATMGLLAAQVWQTASRGLAMVAVTGTAGKTTTTHMIAAILAAAGRPTAVSGTLSGSLTTPESTDLHRWLAKQPPQVAAVAMEVSSHALSLHRVDGVEFDVAVFTNLGVDHLDFHADLDDYFLAKRQLFQRSRSKLGLVCSDDEWGRRLLADTDPDLCPREAYSLSHVNDVLMGPDGSTFVRNGRTMRVHLPGRFNVSNAVGACAVAERLGVDDDAMAAGLESLKSVRGRFERVRVEGADIDVVVDYSHKPDALEAALAAARELARGPLTVVFGAGGDRDRSKRPQMGEVACRLADRVVVTSDNPRSEQPLAIIDQIVAGCLDRDRMRIEPDRALAIDIAVAEATPGELVLIAGKGHETYQIVGDQRHDFDDVAVAAEALERRKVRSGG